MVNYSIDADLRPYLNVEQYLPKTRVKTAIGADDVTLVTFQAESFPDVGTLYLGTEQITYTGLDRTANTFSGLTRGANSTTAATHAANDQVRLYSFEFAHDEATRLIKRRLMALGIDIAPWSSDSKPKIFDSTDLRTFAAQYTAALLMRRFAGAKDDLLLDQARHFEKESLRLLNSLRPRLIILPHTLAVWGYVGGTWYDYSALASGYEGDTVPLMAAAGDCFYLGLDDDDWSSIYVQMATRADYTGLAWSYWTGSAWAALSVTDNTSGLTNTRDQEDVQFTFPGDVVDCAITGGFDTNSRRWVRLSCGAVTTQGYARVISPVIATPYYETINMNASLIRG